MSFIGNVLWFVFGGFWSFLGYTWGAFIMCLTVVGIPFGVQSWKIGVASLAPFGKEIKTHKNTDSPLNIVLNVIWIITAGWAIALAHLTLALGLAVTIVGIPFAFQHLKLLPLAFAPFGRRLE